MPDAGARVRELRALESLSLGGTPVHRLHPIAKILSTLVFIISVASFGRYDFIRLAPYLFYPFVMMALSETPYRLILPRLLIALPFCLFAGLSNAFLDRAACFYIGSTAVSFGVVSLVTILLKMYLCVMAALLLVATTQFTDITAQLRRLRVPYIFVMVFETTYRYISVLLEEVHSMLLAYKLRSGKGKALEIKHMGSFAGQLLLRGFDRAERVHNAMICRGYSLRHTMPQRRPPGSSDVIAASIICLASILLRFFKM